MSERDLIPDELLRGLNERQRAFCREYLVDRNASQAAIRAGYSRRTAGGQAHDLLKKPEIAAAVDAGLAAIARRVDVTAEDVVRRMATLAFGDIGDLFGPDGRLLSIHEMPAAARATLAGFQVERRRDNPDDPVDVVKIKRVDQLRALEMLARHLGLFEADNRQRAAVVYLAAEDAGI